MNPYFPAGSNPNHPNGAPQGSIPPYPVNQAPPQFQPPPMANYPNPNNFAMAMGMLNQNPQLGMQFGFNQAFQNLNAFAAMQFLGQAAQMQQGQMPNMNFLGAGQLLANNLAQGLNQMTNNQILPPFASGYAGPNQGLTQGANMVPMNHVHGTTSGTSNAAQNPTSNQNNIPQQRFQNNKFNHANNPNQFNGTRGRGRGRGNQFNRSGGRGQENRREGKGEGSVFSERPKKKLPLIIYDPKEVKEWREARKRNFPTNSNIEKKLVSRGKEVQKENDDNELRRLQMKQILEKQEELGFEAAEVPTHYLVGSKNKTRYDSNNSDNYRNGPRNSNRFDNKRGRNGGRGRNFSNRDGNNNNNYRNTPRNHNNNSNNNRREFESKMESEPSLLKKLLSTEIKADKSRILQALKFMVLNSFFEEKKELEFPEVRINGEEIEENIKLEDLGDESECESDERENESDHNDDGIDNKGHEIENEKPEEGEITD